MIKSVIISESTHCLLKQAREQLLNHGLQATQLDSEELKKIGVDWRSRSMNGVIGVAAAMLVLKLTEKK